MPLAVYRFNFFFLSTLSIKQFRSNDIFNYFVSFCNKINRFPMNGFESIWVARKYINYRAYIKMFRVRFNWKAVIHVFSHISIDDWYPLMGAQLFCVHNRRYNKILHFNFNHFSVSSYVQTSSWNSSRRYWSILNEHICHNIWHTILCFSHNSYSLKYI